MFGNLKLNKRLIDRRAATKARPALFLFLLAFALLPFAASFAADNSGCEMMPLPPELGKGLFPLHYSLPEKLASDSPVLFVCHGVKRNPEKYLKEWRKYAAELGAVLVAPGFLPEEFPKGRDYNQGRVVAPDKKTLNPSTTWTFNVIELAFSHIKAKFGLNAEKYMIFGHSAGGQFVHRLMIFLPRCSAGLAIAANPGSLTFLSSSDRYPYGMPALPDAESQIRVAMQRPLVLLLGKEDTDPNHKYLENSRLAKKQGAFRLERGRNFFADAQNFALQHKMDIKWQKHEVDGVAHSNRGMAKAAFALFKAHLGK
ncbi:MAG: hypothetical protein AB1403_13510 [Candidatus Riflebacteria bacterium]